MITFLTLFLSLVHGVHGVEMTVDGPVARVEVLLDQRQVTVLTGPPWAARCDFGPRLAPHELVAVAYDEHGNELDRVRQLVNLPRPAAEARIALERDRKGTPVRARVYWDSADTTDPLAVAVTFDGRPVTEDEDGGYPLPDHDPAPAHVVSARVEFPDGLQARADVTFGGSYGTRVGTELTAVPVVTDRGPPPLAELEGALVAADGEAVPVAVEQSRTSLYLVRDERAFADLEPVRRQQAARGRRQRPGPEQPLLAGSLAPDEDRLHVVFTHPVRRKGRELFPTTGGISLRQWDLRWLAANLTGGEAAAADWQQLADAVAVAGLQAAGEGSRRAVIVLLSGHVYDASTFTPLEVRRYLQELRVPLYVWSTVAESSRGWGPAEYVGRARDLKRAAASVERDLERQWVVWITGTHMINRVELSPRARGLALAGVSSSE